MTRFALLLGFGAASIGCQFEGAFACETKDDCSDGRRAGFCEIDGYCSFSDDDCGSGRRYGEHAPDDLAGVCTPEPDADPNFFTGGGESSSSSAGLDSATAPGDADESDEGASEDPIDESSGDDGSSDEGDGGEAGEVDGDDSSSDDGSSSSSGADEEPEDCNALDCASCLDCVARPSGPCDPEVTACEAADGCAAGVACNRSCLLTGLCFEDCCYADVEPLIDDVVMCGADHCIDACHRFEFLTCG